MNRLFALFRLGERERDEKRGEVAKLAVKSEATLARVDQVLAREAEIERLRAATRGVVKAVQRTHGR